MTASDQERRLSLVPISLALVKFYPGWSKTGQILVKHWSNTGQILSGLAAQTRSNTGQIRLGLLLVATLGQHRLAHHISDLTGQTLVEHWSNSGQTRLGLLLVAVLGEDHPDVAALALVHDLVKRWSNAGQTLAGGAGWGVGREADRARGTEPGAREYS